MQLTRRVREELGAMLGMELSKLKEQSETELSKIRHEVAMQSSSDTERKINERLVVERSKWEAQQKQAISKAIVDTEQRVYAELETKRIVWMENWKAQHEDAIRKSVQRQCEDEFEHELETLKAVHAQEVAKLKDEIARLKQAKHQEIAMSALSSSLHMSDLTELEHPKEQKSQQVPQQQPNKHNIINNSNSTEEWMQLKPEAIASRLIEDARFGRTFSQPQQASQLPSQNLTSTQKMLPLQVFSSQNLTLDIAAPAPSLPKEVVHIEDSKKRPQVKVSPKPILKKPPVKPSTAPTTTTTNTTNKASIAKKLSPRKKDADAITAALKEKQLAIQQWKHQESANMQTFIQQQQTIDQLLVNHPPDSIHSKIRNLLGWVYNYWTTLEVSFHYRLEFLNHRIMFPLMKQQELAHAEQALTMEATRLNAMIAAMNTEMAMVVRREAAKNLLEQCKQRKATNTAEKASLVANVNALTRQVLVLLKAWEKKHKQQFMYRNFKYMEIIEHDMLEAEKEELDAEKQELIKRAKRIVQ